MNKRSLTIIALSLIILTPVYASAFYFGGEKSLGLAGAYSAVADDSSAVFMNPAGLALTKTSTMDINYQTDKLPNSKLWGVTFVDSKTGSTAAGFSYYKMGREYFPLLSDREERFVLAISERYSKNLFIGLSYKYIKQRHPTNDEQTGDLGILYLVNLRVTVALVGKNLLDTSIDEVHQLNTAGVSYTTPKGIRLSFDITKDDDSKMAEDITYSYGAELMTWQAIKLRGGYMVDKIQDKKFYAFNVGFATKGFSIGYALMRDEVDQYNIIHSISLKITE